MLWNSFQADRPNPHDVNHAADRYRGGPRQQLVRLYERDISALRRTPSLRRKHLTYAGGDLIKLTIEESGEYISTVLYYGMVIANRHRAKHDLPPVSPGARRLRTPLGTPYIEMYNSPH